MKSNKFLNREELSWLFEHDLIIKSTWISPQEGYEYVLMFMGGDISKHGICTRKSQRACFNYAKRNIEELDNIPKKVEYEKRR